MLEKFFEHKKPIIENLIAYGFVQNNDIFEYQTDILDNQFRLTVSVKPSCEVSTVLYDNVTSDEYVLHLISDACGTFVGAVRNAYDAVLYDIAEKCFVNDVFKSPQTKALISHVEKTYGDKLEFLWQKYPYNAVWRRKDNKKWYAVILTISKRKLGFNSDDLVEIIDLHTTPDDIDSLLANNNYFSGYHMNKRSWYTIILDDSIPNEELYNRIHESYLLAMSKTKKEIL